MLDVELGLLVGRLQPRTDQLSRLETEEVDLARPCASVAAERGERRIDLGEPRPGLTQGAEVGRAEAVEGGPLGRHREQALVGVLAVDVDHPFTELRQGGDSREPTVDVGT